MGKRLTLLFISIITISFYIVLFLGKIREDSRMESEVIENKRIGIESNETEVNKEDKIKDENGKNISVGETDKGETTKEKEDISRIDIDGTDYIRVLIRTSDYESLLHKEVTIEVNGKRKTYKPSSECFQKGKEKVVLEDVEENRIILKGIKRQRTDQPSYRGKIELSVFDNKLLVINELPLEEYLYGVVPSEMPASYQMEALKAQAVCARTYAIKHILQKKLNNYGADVDDSTAYQVYGNLEEMESTNQAVDETKGIVLCKEENVADVTYYSTSCGISTDERIWHNGINQIEVPSLVSKRQSIALEENTPSIEEEQFKKFIQEKQNEDLEKEFPYYRWTYSLEKIDKKELLEKIKERYKAKPELVLTQNKEGEFVDKKIGKLGNLYSINVNKRLAGGIADELIVAGSKNTFLIKSEYNIRYVLCNRNGKLIKQNGEESVCSKLLPSAFFVIITGNEDSDMVGYSIAGGGLGHGAGMSQNGANRLAEEGYSYKELLNFYFENYQIRESTDAL